MIIKSSKLILILFLLGLVLLKANYLKPAFAINDLLQVPNNKYGIHIVDENDLENAATLVNSSNGLWGYVTMVIREDDRNLDKWQTIFNNMKTYKLIPIIRLATKLTGNYWMKPDESEIPKWSDFLNSLSWPIKNRYVIIFNEPNHAKEWGQSVNPEEYGRLLTLFSLSLKQNNPDFFVLPAGLDASAPNSSLTMDEEDFLKQLLNKYPNLENNIDGWTSHSYPNPGFRGKISDLGRGTLQTYDWELNLLKLMGISKYLPVFITETGWPHQEGSHIDNSFFEADDVGNLLTQASQTIWIDSRIAAITPFLMNYQSNPFSNFSWQKQSSPDFYPQYDAYRSIPKIPGEPILASAPETNKSDVLGVDLKLSSKQNNTTNLLVSLLHKLLLLF